MVIGLELELLGWLGMAIQAQPVDTQPDSTLMGRILLGPIKNRVGYGFKTKKLETGLGRVRILEKTRPEPGPDLTRLNLKENY